MRKRLTLSNGGSVTFLLAALVGVLGALATVGFRETLALMQIALGGTLPTGHSGGGLVAFAKSLETWQRVLIPVAGGVLAGLVLLWAGRKPRRGGADYMEAIAVGRGYIGFLPTMAKSVSSVFSISTGASIGREGPMVQLAAMLASITGRFLVLPPRHLRLLVACGATAGITSAYNAPIAGAIFISEIVYGVISTSTLAPLIVASVVANIVTRQILGYEAVFRMPEFELVYGWEILGYLGLGLAAGVLAPRFLGVLDFARSSFGKLNWPIWAKLGLGGLIVGLISTVQPEVWGNGYSVVNGFLHESSAWHVVAVLLVLKIFATAASTGSGAIGGVFTPTLFVGAALGVLYGTALHYFFPGLQLSPASSYAVVGMGALLAATTYAPLMSILMIFEMTLSYEVMLPLMLACMTGFVVAKRIRPQSVYAKSLASNRRARSMGESL